MKDSLVLKSMSIFLLFILLFCFILSNVATAQKDKLD